MRAALMRAFVWLLVQAEEVLSTAWGLVEVLEKSQLKRSRLDAALNEVRDESPGEYVVTVSENTVYTITKLDGDYTNAVHLPRRELN